MDVTGGSMRISRGIQGRFLRFLGTLLLEVIGGFLGFTRAFRRQYRGSGGLQRCYRGFEGTSVRFWKAFRVPSDSMALQRFSEVSQRGYRTF